jgi:hypothetical protein
MDLAAHPLVAGPNKRVGLFWFTISPLFTHSAAVARIYRYLERPEIIFSKEIWATPDLAKHALEDIDNTA